MKLTTKLLLKLFEAKDKFDYKVINENFEAIDLHNHDSRYFTEDEIVEMLKNYSGAGHNHDSRYFTEDEIVEMLKNYASSIHTHSKSDIGLGDVPNVTTNDQTPTYSTATKLETITSGEKLSVAFGKIKYAIASLITHLENKSNPHGVTKAQIGLGNVNNIKITSGTANPSGGSDGDIYLKY